MRLGLFGGSFDPIHYGHLLLAESCREQRGLDRVWFVPACVAPHKADRELTAADHRLAMLELAVTGHEAFAVGRHEVERGGVSYTVDTLRALRDEFPEAELFLLVGADMLHDLPQWREARAICEIAVPLAVGRPDMGRPDFDCLAPVASPERIALFRRHRVAMPQIELSSSAIRRRVAQGLSIRYQTPRAVEKYIQTHGLYSGRDLPAQTGERSQTGLST